MRGPPVTVVAGYDRRLREIFLEVIREEREHGQPGTGEVFLDNSMGEAQKDWTNIVTVIDTLEHLRIAVP